MTLNEQISQIRRLIQFWFWLCQRNSPFVSYAGLISFAAFLFVATSLVREVATMSSSV